MTKNPDTSIDSSGEKADNKGNANEKILWDLKVRKTYLAVLILGPLFNLLIKLKEFGTPSFFIAVGLFVVLCAMAMGLIKAGRLRITNKELEISMNPWNRKSVSLADLASANFAALTFTAMITYFPGDPFKEERLGLPLFVFAGKSARLEMMKYLQKRAGKKKKTPTAK